MLSLMYYFVSNRNIYFVNSLVKYRYVVKKNKKIEINGLALKRPNRTGPPLKFDWQYHFSFLFRETTTFLLERVGNYTNESRFTNHPVKSVTLASYYIIVKIKIIRQNCIDDYYYCQGYIYIYNISDFVRYRN